MKRVKYKPFRLNFNSSFNNSKTTFAFRDVIFFEAEDSCGRIVYSESAPLPEFGTETTDSITNCFDEVIKDILGKEIHSFDDITNLLDPIGNKPSLKCGLEQILIALLIRENPALFPKSTSHFEVNGLIGLNDHQEIEKVLEEKINDGTKAIKLKVNRDNHIFLSQLINNSTFAIKNNIRFRLDANSIFSFEEAERVLKSFDPKKIEYFEQPTSSINEMEILEQNSEIPIALDESLTSYDHVEKLIKDSQIKYFIIKPMVLGGILKINRLKKIANDYGKKLIVSSALESHIGKIHLLFGCAILNNNETHGIDTSFMFSNNPTNDQFPTISGKVDWEAELFLNEVRTTIFE
ncbi:MAG: hypothetical protein K9J12_04195 [Melioribacteraceae bacterium]|nr:hypothetical protein [Melioribacteraceae bacterium]MCF8412978.1 hypothetical protein [Melioribacteraceae bacterium]